MPLPLPSWLIDGLVGVADLVLPGDCPCCGAPGHGVCESCQTALSRAPELVSPKVAVGVPVFSCAPYAGVHRSAVLSAKESLRRDVLRPLGAVMAASVNKLSVEGAVLDPRIEPLVLVPAPTRRSSIRQRGGDVVTAVAEYACEFGAGLSAVAALRSSEQVADSVGLSAGQRKANLSGRVMPLPASGQLRGQNVLLVDDVLTTGATLRESVLVLRSLGARPVAALVICHA